MNKIKGYVYAAALVVIAIALSYIMGCNRGKRIACPVNKDTVSIKHDTVCAKVKVDTEYVPKIESVYHLVPLKVYSTDTLYLPELISVDTGAILKDYFAKIFYSDTQYVFDGYILLKDTISQNRITHREFIADFKIPHDSVTVTLHQPKRSIFYIGAGIIGNNDGNIIKGISTSLGYKTKNDYMYELSTSFIQYNKPLYQGSIKVPIKLRE